MRASAWVEFTQVAERTQFNSERRRRDKGRFMLYDVRRQEYYAARNNEATDRLSHSRYIPTIRIKREKTNGGIRQPVGLQITSREFVIAVRELQFRYLLSRKARK